MASGENFVTRLDSLTDGRYISCADNVSQLVGLDTRQDEGATADVGAAASADHCRTGRSP